MFYYDACIALREGKRVELRYDGFMLIVEVHAVGVSKDGIDIMRVWQVRGGKIGAEQVGWKLVRLIEAKTAIVLGEKSKAPRPGYARDDRAMRYIRCQL